MRCCDYLHGSWKIVSLISTRLSNFSILLLFTFVYLALEIALEEKVKSMDPKRCKSFSRVRRVQRNFEF